MVAIGATASVICLLPVFLTGSLATIIQNELELTAASLGIAVALYRAAGAAASPFLGRSTDRIGATRSLRIATAVAAVASIGIATTAFTFPLLVAWLMIGGCSLALVQPAANRLLTVGVSAKGMGTAFGFKQSAPPVASTLAGLSVPLIAVTIGWRWSFVGVAVLAATMTLWVRPVRRMPNTTTLKGRLLAGDRTALLLLTVAFGLGTWSSSTVTTFFVISVVERGTSEVAAGIMLAVAGALAVLTRVIAGFIADRVPANHLVGCAALVTIGGVGVAVLSVAESVPTQAAAVCLALVGTWGFNGVLWFALMKAYPGSPGAVTGSVAPGALIGSTLGPITFGLIAQEAGYAAAFQSVAVIALLTAVGFVDGNRRIRRMSEDPDSP